jgi:hypothetical protein
MYIIPCSLMLILVPVEKASQRALFQEISSSVSASTYPDLCHFEIPLRDLVYAYFVSNLAMQIHNEYVNGLAREGKINNCHGPLLDFDYLSLWLVSLLALDDRTVVRLVIPVRRLPNGDWHVADHSTEKRFLQKTILSIGSDQYIFSVEYVPSHRNLKRGFLFFSLQLHIEIMETKGGKMIKKRHIAVEPLWCTLYFSERSHHLRSGWLGFPLSRWFSRLAPD